MTNLQLPKISNEIRNALKNLGFTDYYTNIYIGLLQAGELNAHDLSELTNVPYSRIYEVLNVMIERNIILKLDGRPSTFLANNPAEVFKTLKKRQEQDFEQNASECFNYLKGLYGEISAAKQENLTIYQGNKACRDHLRTVLNATARTLLFACKVMDTLFPMIQMNLEFLKAKGVDCQFLLEERLRSHEVCTMLRKFGTLHFTPIIIQGLVISDDKTAFQVLKGAFNIINRQDQQYLILNSTSDSYITYLTELFKNFWRNSQE